jgi:inorganic pyrophosphatase
MDSIAFWEALDRLIASHSIHLDHPKGTAHPTEPSLVYPMDYGCLEGTVSSDGDGIDVWCGSLKPSLVTGVICTVDGKKADVELKLLVGCTPDEAAQALAIHNRGLQSALLLERPA